MSTNNKNYSTFEHCINHNIYLLQQNGNRNGNWKSHFTQVSNVIYGHISNYTMHPYVTAATHRNWK